MPIQNPDGSPVPKKDQGHSELIPSEDNELVAKADDADMLQDRTSAGDMGPEDAETKRGSTKDEASY